MSTQLQASRILIAAALGSVVGLAWAQDEGAPRTSFSRLLNIDALIDNHVRFLARRYNLSEEQESYTLALLHEKTDAFMQRHRDELYDLIDRLVEVRAGADVDPQELMKWGRRAQPLYDEARTLIIDGNNQWREILTEEQKRIHDEDLREMHESFATTESQLQRIVGGQMTVEEFRQGPGQAATTLRRAQAPRAPMRSSLKEPSPVVQDPGDPRAAPSVAPASPGPAPQSPPSHSAVSKQPNEAPAKTEPAPDKTPPTPPSIAEKAPAPARPAANKGNSPREPRSRPDDSRGRGPKGARPATGADFESQWDQYVREFIARYQLDDAQSQRAWSILKTCKESAQRIVDKRKPEIERLDRKLLALTQSKENSADKLKELAEVNNQRTKLLEPIGEIFEKQLKPRLEKLPTRAQRAAAEENAKRPNPAKPEGAGQRPGRPHPVPPPPPETEPQPMPEPPPPEQPPVVEEDSPPKE